MSHWADSRHDGRMVTSTGAMDGTVIGENGVVGASSVDNTITLEFATYQAMNRTIADLRAENTRLNRLLAMEDDE